MRNSVRALSVVVLILCVGGSNAQEPAITRHGDGRTWQNDLFVMNADGSDQRALTHSSFRKRGPVWSPNGREIAYSGEARTQDIFVMRADGTDSHNATSSPNIDEYDPAWSPSGTEIAYAGHSSESSSIFIMNVETAEILRLTRDGSHDNWPTWSPDGKQIAFARRNDSSTELCILDIESSLVSQITSYRAEGYHVMHPSWSPDGKQIAYSLQIGTHESDIYSIELGSGMRALLHSSPGHDRYPDWAPNGRKLVFSSAEPDSINLYRMDADGSNVRLVSEANKSSGDEQPDWSPDGKSILFSKTRALESGNSGVTILYEDGHVEHLPRATHLPAYCLAEKDAEGKYIYTGVSESDFIRLARERRPRSRDGVTRHDNVNQ